MDDPRVPSDDGKGRSHVHAQSSSGGKAGGGEVSPQPFPLRTLRPRLLAEGPETWKTQCNPNFTNCLKPNPLYRVGLEIHVLLQIGWLEKTLVPKFMACKGWNRSGICRALVNFFVTHERDGLGDESGFVNDAGVF
jgi:hypothetical protein